MKKESYSKPLAIVLQVESKLMSGQAFAIGVSGNVDQGAEDAKSTSFDDEDMDENPWEDYSLWEN